MTFDGTIGTRIDAVVAKLVEDLGKKKERRDWTGFDEQKSREYYEAKHEGRTRADIQKIDPPFYYHLMRNGLLHIMPKKPRRWDGYDEDRYRDHYQRHHEGKTRNEVSKDDPGFYQQLHKHGLLHIIPRGGWREFDEQRSREYYEKNLSGKNRRQVYEDAQGFYSHLKRKRLLHILPSSRTVRKTKKRSLVRRKKPLRVKV